MCVRRSLVSRFIQRFSGGLACAKAIPTSKWPNDSNYPAAVWLNPTETLYSIYLPFGGY